MLLWVALSNVAALCCLIGAVVRRELSLGERAYLRGARAANPTVSNNEMAGLVETEYGRTIHKTTISRFFSGVTKFAHGITDFWGCLRKGQRLWGAVYLRDNDFGERYSFKLAFQTRNSM